MDDSFIVIIPQIVECNNLCSIYIILGIIRQPKDNKCIQKAMYRMHKNTVLLSKRPKHRQILVPTQNPDQYLPPSTKRQWYLHVTDESYAPTWVE